MKFKKSLITLAAASSVAMAGIPAATAEEAPAAQDAPVAAATENEAGNDEAGADETKPEDEAGADENEPANGSADSEKGQKLKGSIDKLVGWDESTSTIQKIKDVLGFIGKIVKIVL
ncbi:hypothetical protein ACKFRT_10075 [Corynebacterium sp. YSMAA1_1_F7]|uniref:hypothetical protein n=1 Tax=Corynebacterium sp. YSMAA1_1_F7 TaxID=3383590 RepID=UPI0025EC0A19|nr:hypothetical protein [uncultured Corynebacterium sp.]